MGQSPTFNDVKPTSTEMGQVTFFDDNNAYVTSKEGIFSSTDGGLTWQLASGTTTDKPGPVNAYTADRAVAVQGDMVYRSTDHGQTWTALSKPPISAIFDINFVQFVDDNYGWVGAHNRDTGAEEVQLWRTADGGQSWQITGSPLRSAPNGNYTYPFWRGMSGLLFTDSLTGYYSLPDSNTLSFGSLIRTTDGGLSWNTVIAGAENRTIQQIGDSLLFWSIHQRSTDGGQTWNGPAGTPNADEYSFWSANDYLFGINVGLVLPTRTNTRWFFGNDQGSPAFIGELPFCSRAWALNQGQTLVVQSTSMELGFNGIVDQYIFRSDNLVNRPDPIEMEQVRIFPQPAHNQLHIALPEGTLGEELSVVDALGRVVWEKEKVSTGEPIDTSSWPAGMYHLRMTVRGQALTKAVVIQR